MLPQIVRQLRAYAPLIVLLAIVGGVSAYTAAKSDRTYTAKSNFRLITDDVVGNLLSTTTSGQRQSTDSPAEPEAAVITSDAVLDRLAREVGGAVDGGVGIGVNPKNRVVQVTAEAESRERAAELSNGLLRAYVGYKTEVWRRAIGTTQRTLDRQAAALLRRASEVRRDLNRADSASERAQLGIRLDAATERYEAVFARQQEIDAQANAQPQFAAVVRTATPASAVPSSTRRTGVLGLLLGGLLGVAIALVREQFRDAVHDEDAVTKSTGLVTLAALPRPRAWRRDRLPVLKSPAGPHAEALRSVRVNLRRFAGDAPGVVLVTSPGRHDGKTFVASNLAVVSAQGGTRTILLSADLRDPAADRLFPGAGGSAGLAQLLAPTRGDRLGVSDIVRELHDTSVPGLRILPAGQPTANPADLLAQPALADVIAALREEAELVIVDTPPLLAVSDPLLLAEHADATLLVTALDRTRRGDLQRAAELLRGAVVRNAYSVMNGRADRLRGVQYPPPALAAVHVERAART